MNCQCHHDVLQCLKRQRSFMALCIAMDQPLRIELVLPAKVLAVPASLTWQAVGTYLLGISL